MTLTSLSEKSHQFLRERAGDGRLAPVVALAFGVAGIGWRVAMLLLDVPPTNSDEATAGLAALHIAQGRDYPIFFYGQHYLGTIQSFLAAPLFALSGPSTLLLRVPPLLAYGLFLFLMYRLTRKILSPWIAVATVGVLALGADRVVRNQLVGAGGYAELGPMLVALFVIAVGLATDSYRGRNWAFAGWGLICGLALWTHWLAAPYLLGAGILLVMTCWRRLWGAGGLIAASTIVLGVSPLLWNNLTAPREFNSISIFRELASAGGDPPLWDRLYGGVVIGLPLASGLCSPGYCDPARLWWSPVYLALLGLAGWWAARAWWRAGGTRVSQAVQSPERVRHLAVVILAFTAVLTVVLYVRSSAAAKTPYESGRYLHYLLVSTPVWVWALWRLAEGAWGRFARLPAIVFMAGAVAFMVLATGTSALRTPDYRAWARENRQLVTLLKSRGVTYVYGGYWTCNRLIFDTSERIVCAVVADDLRPGFNRYPPYWEEVASRTGPPAFVTRVASNSSGPEIRLDAAVRKMLAKSGGRVTVSRVGEYTLYQPDRPLRLP